MFKEKVKRWLSWVVVVGVVSLLSIKQVEAKEPTLLWKKEFATKINAVAMSGDGKYIAVTTDAESEGPTTGEPFKGSKLCFFDKEGNLFWEYEQGDDYWLAGVEMSEDGSYTAVALAKKVVLSSGIIEGEYYETVEFHVNEFLFFDRFGNLLWRALATGYPQMSKDGEYILVTSDYPSFYHKFFDKKGNLLWQKPYTPTDPWSLGSGISIDGNYVIIGNTLYNKKGETICIYDVEEEVIPLISPEGDYIAFETREKILCYDKHGKLLWEYPRGRGANLVKFFPTGNLIIETVEEIKTLNKEGRLLWSKTKDVKDTHSVQGCDFTKDGNFFAIGTIKSISSEPYFVKSSVRFCDKDGNIIWKLDFPGDAEPRSKNIFLSSDGKCLAIAYDKVLYFYDNSKAIE